jgi:uncharacterized membrane protein (UPF0127 family)
VGFWVAGRLRALNHSRNTVLVEDGWVANTAWTRLCGLLGHTPLRPGEGLLLRGEKAIHTIGMGFAIDVLFLDREGFVRFSIPAMSPFRASPFVSAAADVLELPSGTIVRTRTELGDRIALEYS